jgi:hypothetical protein
MSKSDNATFFQVRPIYMITHVKDIEDSSLLRVQNSPVFFKQIGSRVGGRFSFFRSSNQSRVILLGGGGGGGGHHLFPRAVPDHLLIHAYRN